MRRICLNVKITMTILVKCTGGYPCARCANKGIQCFYSPRKKRGAPKGKPTDLRQGPIIVRSEVNGNVARGTLSKSNANDTFGR